MRVRISRDALDTLDVGRAHAYFLREMRRLALIGQVGTVVRELPNDRVLVQFDGLYKVPRSVLIEVEE